MNSYAMSGIVLGLGDAQEPIKTQPCVIEGIANGEKTQ